MFLLHVLGGERAGRRGFESQSMGATFTFFLVFGFWFPVLAVFTLLNDIWMNILAAAADSRVGFVHSTLSSSHHALESYEGTKLHNVTGCEKLGGFCGFEAYSYFVLALFLDLAIYVEKSM